VSNGQLPVVTEPGTLSILSLGLVGLVLASTLKLPFQLSRIVVVPHRR
jgi:hypothetical protein